VKPRSAAARNALEQATTANIHSKNDGDIDIENANDMAIEDDDTTVVSGTKATKTDYIEQEMGERVIRFKNPFPKGQANNNDTQIHVQLLKVLTKMFDDTGLRIYNNKNLCLKNFEEEKWLDTRYCESHFDIHMNTAQRKTNIAHCIYNQRNQSQCSRAIHP
jgi:hypothetical protein